MSCSTRASLLEDNCNNSHSFLNFKNGSFVDKYLGRKRPSFKTSPAGLKNFLSDLYASTMFDIVFMNNLDKWVVFAHKRNRTILSFS